MNNKQDWSPEFTTARIKNKVYNMYCQGLPISIIALENNINEEWVNQIITYLNMIKGV